MRLKHAMQIQRHMSFHIGKTHVQHPEAFPPGISRGQSWTPLESSALLPIPHWCLSDIHNRDSRCRTVGCSLTSHPGHFSSSNRTCAAIMGAMAAHLSLDYDWSTRNVSKLPATMQTEPLPHNLLDEVPQMSGGVEPPDDGGTWWRHMFG